MAPLLDILIAFIPMFIVLILTVGVFLYGRTMNKRIMKKHLNKLEQATEGVVKSYNVEKKSISGIVLETSLSKSLPVRWFKVVYSLEDRHLLLSLMAAIFSKSRDMVLFEANLPERPATNIEIIPVREKSLITRNNKFLVTLDDVYFNVKQFDDYFVVKSSNPKLAYQILGDKEIIRQLYTLREDIYWISVDRKEKPWYKFMCHATDTLDYYKYQNLFFLMAGRTSEWTRKSGRWGKKSR
ncbi:MAG: hypothetical protein ACFFCQ_11935 [Promethearchaeota archaeon]